MSQDRPSWVKEDYTITAWPKARQPAEQSVVRCAYAQRFWEWCERLVDQYLTNLPSGEEGTAQINQALLHLQDGYMRHRHRAQPEHQDKLDSTGHQCLYGVWLDVYERIDDIRVRQIPAPLVVKKPPEPSTTVSATTPPQEALFYDTPIPNRAAGPAALEGDVVAP